MIAIDHRQLGFIDPVTVTAVEYLTLNYFDEQKVKALVDDFPAIFEQAKRDWNKFKAGAEYGAFTPEQRDEILGWFIEFPQLWESIRPNFIKTPAGLEWSGQVDDFVGQIKRNDYYKSTGLGLPAAVIAGVFVVGGVAAALWAIAYIKRQANLSKLIDQVTAGKVPADVLAKAVEPDRSGILGNIGAVTGLAQAAGMAFLLWYVIKNMKS